MQATSSAIYWPAVKFIFTRNTLMVRKLVLALAMVGAFYSGVVNALGLGEIKLNSALNQPLSAEIELLQTRALSENEILPNLASREDFNNAGLERVFFLTQMKFEINVREDGTKYLSVTTKKAVREPYLNFLVEVHWPSGRLLREYTLLLDPPVFAQEQQVVAPVVAPTVPASQSVVSAPVPQAEMPKVAPAVQAPVTVPEPKEQSVVTPKPEMVVAPKPTIQTAPTSQVEKVAAVQEAPKTYKTKRNDTLWEIAAKARPKNKASVQQTMVAIQRLNPEAFIQNNVNKLKTGKVLRLPDEKQITQVTAREAIGVIAQQNRQWHEDRQARVAQLDATRRNKTGKVTRDTEVTGRLRLAAPEKEGSATSAAGDASKTSSSDNVSKLESKLAMTMENLEKAKSENSELESKLTDIEGQADKLERLLSLKSEQLAALQAKLSDEERLKAEAAAKEAEDMVKAEAALAAADKSISDAGKPEGDVVERPQTEKPDPVVAEIKPLPQSSKPVGESKKDATIVDTLLADPMYSAAAVGVLLLLIGGLFVIARGKHRDEQDGLADFDDVNFDNEPADFSLGGEADVSDADEVGDDVAPGSESDPISAADIYVAYGRFSEASDRLKEAISSEPERIDLRLKLMEVYAESQDLEGFEQQQAEIADNVDAATGARIEEIKAQFSTVNADAAPEFTLDDLENELAESSVDSFAEPSLEDLELDLDSSLNEAVQEDEVGEFDFDLDGEASITSDTDASVEAEVSLDDLEFELDADTGIAEDSIASADELDFSLDEDLTADSDVDAGADLDIALDELGDLDIEADVSNEESLEELESTLEDVDLDLDLSEASDDLAEDGSALGSLVDGLEDINADLEFDEGGADLDALADIETVDDAEAVSEDITELDIDLSLDEELGELGVDDADLTEVAESEDLASLDLDTDLDFDLGGVDGSEDLVAEDLESDEGLVEPAGVEEAEVLDSVVAEVVPEPEIALSDDELGDDFDFLAGTDEAATKLDLAKAYIDMGDTEGARDILDEVVSEGSDEQQGEARELISSIS